MGATKERKAKYPGRGLCPGCLRSMFVYGQAGLDYCDACTLALRRYPGRDLGTLRNGRSERLPQERPVIDRAWRDREDGPLCYGMPIELFEHRQLSNDEVPQEIRDAARVFCAACPVFAKCAAEADEHEYVGLWAGSWRYYTTSSRPIGYRVRRLLDADADQPAATPAA